MKSCPTCQRKYDDATLSFCPNDGTPLVTDAPSSFDPQATIMATPPKVTNPSGPFDQSPPPAPSNWGAPQQPSPPSAWGDPPAQQAAGTPYYPAPAGQGEGRGIGSKLMPAAVGGVITGILTIIPIVNYGCCLWSIIGGGVAGLMYIKSSPKQVMIGEGAGIGAMAGGIGWLLYLIIGLPLYYLIGASFATAPNQGVAMGVGFLVGALLTLIVLIPFSLLGGILSVSIFEKRKPEMPSVPPPSPQQPQNYGGGGYGGGYR